MATHRPPAYRGAVLLRALGAELAARVLACMPDHEVEVLVSEMMRLEHVSPQERDRIVHDSEEALTRYVGGISPNPEYAREVLEQAVGPDRAANLLNRERHEGPSLAMLLRQATPEALVAAMQDEHPQLLALLINQLPLDKAAEVLTALPEALQGEMTARLVQLETPSPRALKLLERALADKLGTGGSREKPAGPKQVADILGRMRRSVETSFISTLEERSPDLARQVNQHRFTFDNLLEQEDRALQRVLRDADPESLPMVMKGLSDEQRVILLRNMSERAAERIREEVDALGPVKVRDVEAAQQALVGLARSLADRGEIQLALANDAAPEETLV